MIKAVMTTTGDQDLPGKSDAFLLEQVLSFILNPAHYGTGGGNGNITGSAGAERICRGDK